MSGDERGALAEVRADRSPAAPKLDHGAACSCGHDHGHAHDHVHRQQPHPFDASALVSARGLKLVRAGRAILDGVDIDIRKGEIVTLIGPNGAGKTSLVRLILGLEKPDAGKLVRPKDLVIGYVPQRFDRDAALPITVDRFLRIGTQASESDVIATMNAVGAGGLGSRQLTAISGGELQRILIARAVLRSPDLLVLDEPVRGVDYTGEADLYGLIARLRDARGFAVLLVSHDLHVVMASSDRVLCLNRHVCCSGVPETVAQHPEYVRLFGPEAARALGLYHHHHDHAHDLEGRPISPPGRDRRP